MVYPSDPRSTEAGVALARTLIEHSGVELSPDTADAVLGIYRSMVARQGINRVGVRLALRETTGPLRAVCLALAALSQAHAVFASAACHDRKHRAARRVEAYGRRARLRQLACLARSLRRRTVVGAEFVDSVRSITGSLRAVVVGRLWASLGAAIGDCVFVYSVAGLIDKSTAKLASYLLQSSAVAASVSPNVVLHIQGARDGPVWRRLTATVRTHHRVMDLLQRNRLVQAARLAAHAGDRTRAAMRLHSLGCVHGDGERGLHRSHPVDRLLLVASGWRPTSPAYVSPWDFSGGIRGEAEAIAMVGRPRSWKLLRRAVARDRPAYEALLVGLIVARHVLGAGEARRALRWLARASWAYAVLLDVARHAGVEELPRPMRQFERLCGRTLRALHARRARGNAAVRAVARLDREVRWARRRRPPRMAAAAADLMRIGGSLGADDTQERVVDLVSRLLAGKVLFVRPESGAAIWQVPQTVHTLTSWTMHRLETLRSTRAYSVRPRPEFWRPEQHRPGAILVARLGTVLVAFARQTRFRCDEIAAVRRVGEILRVPAGRRPPPHAPLLRAVAGPATGPSLPDQAPFRSRRWKRLMEQVWKVGPTRASVVLVGETGTGKEVVARTIHLASRRARGPFVAVNCGAVHPDTMHSELFGHVRGAFTGASRNHDGLLVQAHRGTIFLDEVADMPLAMQTALLRVIENRTVRPVGGRSDIPVDVRIVCASHRPLSDEVAAGRFRSDLHHRLSVLDLHLPPLRSRLEDLPLLVEHLLGRLDRPRQVCAEGLEFLRGYHWPGNVRELDNLLQAAAHLDDAPVIPARLIADLLAHRLARRGQAPEAPREATLNARQAQILRLLRRRWLSAPGIAGHLGVSTRTANRELLALCNSGLVESSGEARQRRYRSRTGVRRDLA